MLCRLTKTANLIFDYFDTHRKGALKKGTDFQLIIIKFSGSFLRFWHGCVPDGAAVTEKRYTHFIRSIFFICSLPCDCRAFETNNLTIKIFNLSFVRRGFLQSFVFVYSYDGSMESESFHLLVFTSRYEFWVEDAGAKAIYHSSHRCLSSFPEKMRNIFRWIYFKMRFDVEEHKKNSIFKMEKDWNVRANLSPHRSVPKSDFNFIFVHIDFFGLFFEHISFAQLARPKWDYFCWKPFA